MQFEFDNWILRSVLNQSKTKMLCQLEGSFNDQLLQFWYVSSYTTSDIPLGVREADKLLTNHSSYCYHADLSNLNDVPTISFQDNRNLMIEEIGPGANMKMLGSSAANSV